MFLRKCNAFLIPHSYTTLKSPQILFFLFLIVIELTPGTATFSLYSVTFDTFKRHDHQPWWRALFSRQKPWVLLSGYVRSANQSSKLMAEVHGPLKEVKLNDHGSLVSCPFNIRISVGNRIDTDPTLEASWCTCITACDISSRVAWGNCCLHRPNNSVSLTCGSGKSNYQLQRWAHRGPRAALKALGCHPFCLPSQNENWVVCRVIKCVC